MIRGLSGEQSERAIKGLEENITEREFNQKIKQEHRKQWGLQEWLDISE